MSLDATSIDPQFELKMREFSGSKVYEFENIRLDADHLLLFNGPEQLGLAPKVVETLRALIERRGEIVSKDELMSIVWPDAIVEESNLYQNLYLLRKTLGNARDGKPFVETLRRRGFRFSGDVRVVRRQLKPVESDVSLKIERSNNIYSVVDWQRPAHVETHEPGLGKVARSATWKVRVLWTGAAFAVILVLIAVAVSSGRMFSISAGRSSIASSELTFTHVTNGIDLNGATISPDGDYIAYHEIDGDIERLWLQQTGQSTRVELVPPSARAYGSKTFAPDGRSIFFIAADRDRGKTSVYRIQILGGEPVKIADDVASTIAVAPDGMHIAFARNKSDNSSSAIIIASTDGTGERTLLTSPVGTGIWGGLSWSPDGGAIAFGQLDLARPAVEGRCTIAAADPQNGSVHQISSDLWDGCGRMEWTPDGKGIYLIGSRKSETTTIQRDQLYFLSVDTGESRRLTTEGTRHDVSSLGVTRDGSVLILPFNRSSQLWSMDAGGNSATARQITNGIADGRAGIAPLADGRIGYIARSGENLGVWVVDADGANARCITSESLNFEELRASSDGHYFYFATFERRPRLMRSDIDGSNLTQMITDATFDVDTSFSPDEKWIVYNSASSIEGTPIHTLRLSSIDGTNSRELAGPHAETPNFSPDGRHLSFVGDGGLLRVITVPDAQEVATFKPRSAAVLNIGARWVPDGSALAYIVKQKGAGNIWLQALDGAEPRQLTDFTSGDVYNFAFSTDGTRLILARGYPIHDAVLIKAAAR